MPSTSASPSFELLGQPEPGAETADSRASSASVQTPSPEPTEGLIVKPSGRLTTDFSTGEVILPSSCSRPPPSLMSMLKTKPVALAARSVRNWAFALERNSTQLVGVSPTAAASASFDVSCQERAETAQSIGAWQE